MKTAKSIPFNWQIASGYISWVSIADRDYLYGPRVMGVLDRY